jgi:hypothetical protein
VEGLDNCFIGWLIHGEVVKKGSNFLFMLQQGLPQVGAGGGGAAQVFGPWMTWKVTGCQKLFGE